MAFFKIKKNNEDIFTQMRKKNDVMSNSKIEFSKTFLIK